MRFCIPDAKNGSSSSLTLGVDVIQLAGKKREGSVTFQQTGQRYFGYEILVDFTTLTMT